MRAVASGVTLPNSLMSMGRGTNAIYSQELTKALRTGELNEYLNNNCGYLGHGVERFTSFPGVFCDINSRGVTKLFKMAKRSADGIICNIERRDIHSTIASLSSPRPGSEREIAVLLCVMAKVGLHVTYDGDPDYVSKRPAFTFLDHHIENGGQCIDFSLIGMAIMQRFRNEGYLKGNIRRREGHQPGNKDIRHSWIEYGYDHDFKIIVDPTALHIISYLESERGSEERIVREFGMVRE